MFGKEFRTKKSKKVMHKRIVTDLLDTNGDAVESWRVFRIMSEFVTGFELLRKYGLAATIFGSARFQPGDKYYKEAEELSARLSKKGFAIITGGGPGIMEAGNRGAMEAGGPSVGLNIELPREQVINPYVTDSLSFYYFFSRKTTMSFAAGAYIFFPGGFGTLDEFFEIITLIQTKKLKKIPIVLVGSDFWIPLQEFIKNVLLQRHGSIDKKDLDLYAILDDQDSIISYITKGVPK
ncbi:MAG: hypothetical protein UY04_C0035G0001 [Parcubacteria group bacterium GW2011_GWA2_47_7]|nr:MAG: hypothetical protein UY04_C0035G0001 [Parcubacteria group bacterium GW2011_GWA2_47_7]